MRVVIDEDTPAELTPRFQAPGHVAQHVEEIGLKGKRNSDLLIALTGTADILVTGDTNLGYQQNLRWYDVAIILIHPRLLVVEQIAPLIPLVVAAYPTARKHAITTVGLPIKTRRRPPARKPRT